MEVDALYEEKEEAKKLWKGNKRQAKLVVSIHGRKTKSLIHIGKDVLRVLGAPSYVCFKVNQDMSSFIVAPSEEKETLSFKVPDNIYLDNNVMMRVTSQSFVVGLLAMNNIDSDHTYRIAGTYSEKNNAVVFNMKDITLFGETEDGEV